MSCEDMRLLIHGYLDGELDPAKSLEIEHHLAGCPGCAGELARYQALSRAVAENAVFYRAPHSLEDRLRASLRSSAPPDRHAEGVTRARSYRWPRLAMGTAVAAVLLLGFLAGLFTGRLHPPPAPATSALLADEVLASHVRSLMGAHLVDVVSSDQHTVKPWFDGKLDYSPPVVDLAASGFPLAGGRLDYVGNRPVAALVYRRHRHLINLYLWPTEAPSSPVISITRQGYHIDDWTAGGMEYWGVSDVSPTDLAQFVRLIQHGVAHAGTGPETR